MKIALYVPSWPPGSSANGIVTYAAEIVPALRELGHEVFVLTSDHTADTDDGHTIDLSKIRLSNRLWSRLRSLVIREHFVFSEFAAKLRAAILMLTERSGLDVLEIEESFGWGGAVAQANIIPVVIRLHGPWFLNGYFDEPDQTRNRKRVRREGRGIDHATLVTAPCADVLESVRAHYGLSLRLARVIPNPFSVSHDRSIWRLSECNPHRMLYVGRFDRRKGGDLVLRAFANLAELYPKLRLSFVGPDIGVSNGGERLSFDQFVRTNIPLSCRSRIDFYGKLTHEEVMTLRSEHFLTIVASQFEILPYSVIEAMALGCPIVASNVGGIPELIKNRRNGILFENQDVLALTFACQELLDNHSLASALGWQAREDCLKSLNAQRAAVETISAYRTAVEIFQADRHGPTVER
jgi:glycosyltransferase involved in cell wall biosynthesis